jgi:hypothetical protein
MGNWNKSTIEFRHSETQSIPLSAKGKFNGDVYEVIGFVVKKETKYRYKWREYFLFNPYKGYAFLSEYNGHWNFIWPLESDPRINLSDSDFYHEGFHFRLYQRFTAKVLHARGEFFFDIVDITSTTTNYEYIAPPYLLALEQSEDSTLWVKGEYLWPKEVAEAFSIPVNKLPSKEGVGYTQPFNSGFRDKSLIQFTVIIFIISLVIQLFLSTTAQDTKVFQVDYNNSMVNDQKLLVSPSFDLQDTKNLAIDLYAPLSNDWFFGEFTLVNETDGSEYNFTKDIEFYSGYEEGEFWTEGSRNGEAILSSIPAGRYHLNIYPEFSLSNQSFSISVKRDVPTWSNFYITCFIVLIYPAIYFIRKRYREQKRWSDSEYSPYDSE